ncbi:MAG: hypothetical protein A2W25_12405 [candidate division Zixibacteria bacterium RBG_16_53_22]|nr:MAG: hypothetical protein A2W25_12405 [candidate division Zixibacteria bacterium RBG_16_53_22]
MDMKKFLRERWPYIYFLVLTVTVFAGFIFSNKMLFGSDTIEAGIFFRSFYADFVREYHRIPLWNPYIFCGLPFVDAMHGDTFYPLAALQFVLPLFKALGYKLVITVFLAGVFTHLYLRKMEITVWASVIGGTIYMLSGFLVSLVYAGHDGRMYVTSLLPFLLYTIEIGFRRRNLLWWWPFAVAFALLILANHPQFAYFSMWCVGAYFLLRLIFLFKENRVARDRVTAIAGFIIAMGFGLCLALVSIWPTQDYVRRFSPRAAEGRGYEYASSWALHAEEAFSQIVPGLSGYSTLSNHPPLSTEQTYWGKNYFKINSEYAGLVAIILGLVGLFIYRDRYSFFFLGMAVFALLYALGDSGVIFKPIYNIVPFVSKFRAPSTIMFLFCFAVMFLGARAVDQFEKNKKITNGGKIELVLIIMAGIYLLKGLIIAASGMSIMKIYTSIFYPKIEPGQLGFLQSNLSNITGGLILGAFLLAAIAALLWAYFSRKISFAAIAVAIIGLVLIDSWIINDMKFIRTVDHQPYFAKIPAVNYLERQSQPFRILALPQTLSNQNLLAQFGIEQVVGYHGNQLKWFDIFLGGSNQANLGKPSFLSLTNAEYIISRQAINAPSLERLASPGGVEIYRYRNALPRARIVYQYETIPDEDKALVRLYQPDFDYVNKIIVDRNPALPITQPASQPTDTVVFLKSPPDRIKVQATLAGPGLLALQDNWYPYWKAFSGGSELPIFRADYTFMAVELPPGSHEIEFRIENPKYILGKNITILSWLILIVGLVAGGFVGARRHLAPEK